MSEENKEKVEQTEETPVDKKEKKVPRKELEKALAELEKAKADAEHWKNEYYRAYADTQNLRKSLEADSRNAIRYRAEGFLTNLLPALDAFHMALDTPAPTPEARNYQIGFTYIYNQIINAVADEGVTELAPKIGDKFDLNTMHAMDTIETEEIEENCVAKVLTKGYKLHDRLIRASMVVVAKKPAPKTEEPAEETKEETKEAPQA